MTKAYVGGSFIKNIYLEQENSKNIAQNNSENMKQDRFFGHKII